MGFIVDHHCRSDLSFGCKWFMYDSMPRLLTTDWSNERTNEKKASYDMQKYVKRPSRWVGVIIICNKQFNLCIVFGIAQKLYINFEVKKQQQQRANNYKSLDCFPFISSVAFKQSVCDFLRHSIHSSHMCTVCIPAVWLRNIASHGER